jgi:hypothetical protein
MPVSNQRGEYFADQAIRSQYTVCLVCLKHIDAPPVFHYNLGPDRIFLHGACTTRLLAGFAADLIQVRRALDEGTAGVLNRAAMYLLESFPKAPPSLPEAEIIDAEGVDG